MKEFKWIKVKRSTKKDKDVFEFWDRIAEASCRLENNKTQSEESSKDASVDDNNKKAVMKTKRVVNSRKSKLKNGPLRKTEVPKFIVDAKKVEKHLVDNFTGGMHVPH